MHILLLYTNVNHSNICVQQFTNREVNISKTAVLLQNVAFQKLLVPIFVYN